MCIRDRNKLSKPRIGKDTKTIFILTTYTNIMPKFLTSVLNNNNRTVILFTVILFKTKNNVMNILRNKITIPLEKKTGLYKLLCDDCECFYIGQTGRGFQKRFIEHTPKHNLKGQTSPSSVKSNYARHLINENHKYISSNSNLKPIYFCNKGAYMNALEEFEIYRAYNLSLIHI